MLDIDIFDNNVYFQLMKINLKNDLPIHINKLKKEEYLHFATKNNIFIYI